MKSTFLANVHSGLEVDRWIAHNKYRLIRCIFKNKRAGDKNGAVIWYMEGK